jgi:RsiW-degrading membrane proteinase PrsW (M82 family)
VHASTLALSVLALAAPPGLFALFARLPRAEDADPRRPPRRRRLALVAVTAALGAALFLPAWLFEGWIGRWSGLDEHARAGADLAALVYAFFVAAPLEQGLKVAAVFPAWRTRFLAGPRDGILFGAAAALGFVSAHNVELFFDPEVTSLDLGRGLLAAPAHVFLGAAWGYALGREAAAGPSRRLGGRAFNAVWLVAMLLNGLYDHLVFGRSAGALVATAPVLLAMAIIAVLVGRGLATPDERGGRPRPRRLVIAPPTLGAVRAALWRTEQPVMFGWIGAGALVTIGVITATLAGAVVLGRRLGVDFASVDRGDGSAAGAAPLVLLGAAALAAFPVAGYLVARASSARSVLESAIAAALAIVGGLVLLGLAAPVSVVFALAFAPVALGLACAGAWMGITSR